MNDKQFVEAYCHNCGTQRCEGIGTEWFEGCKYRWNHDSYDAAAEIERLDKKIMEMAREMVGRGRNKMFKWIKTKSKKQYCVRWIDEDKDTCQDIVRAKDIAEAWDIIKREYGWRAIYCISIIEVADSDFNMKEK